MSSSIWQRSCDSLALGNRVDVGGASVEVATAAIWWSILVEPGDAALGFVEQLCGRQAALDALFVSDSDRGFCERIAQKAGEHGAGRWGPDEQRVLTAAWARWMPRVDLESFRRVISTADSMSMSVLVPGDRWPTNLDDLGVHRPACLWVRGEWGVVSGDERAAAVVGARAASAYGEHCAMDISGGLARRDVTIISGGAYGIDGAAHRAAIAVGGRTVAVLAGGADRLYPSGHEQLLRRIIDNGAVVSEAAPGTAPTRWRFLQRNRVIAACSGATVVVEAGRRSGSLNTAHHALTLGRPLGAVPGPITSTSSQGCHALLRDAGAVCITGVDDALALAGYGDEQQTPVEGQRAAATAPDASTQPEQTRVVDALDRRRPRGLTEVVRLTGMEPGSVIAVLGGLEAEGVISALAGGWVRARE